MAATSLDNFFRFITPSVPECPEFVVREHLAEAAAQFCQETQCWRVPLEASPTVAGEGLYDVDVPAGTVVEAIIAMEVDAQRVAPALEALELPTSSLDDRGKPMAYALVGDRQIQFYPTPDGVYTYRGLVAVKPTLSASSVEEFIYQSWGRSIAYGAIGTLKLVPGKAWSDPKMAEHYLALFNKGIAQCKRREYRNTPIRVRFPGFA
jgi:hypothetical protein